MTDEVAAMRTDVDLSDEPAHPRIFTMGDSGYFLGIVALINSLRITGNDQPVTVLDLGLTTAQRAVLAPRCTFIESQRMQGMKPWVLAPFAYVVDPHGVVAIIDSDIIITSSLKGFFDQAAAGQIVVFPEPVCPDRRFTAWKQEFKLLAELREGQPYVNAGCIFFSTEAHPEFLSRWWECCVRIASTPTMLDDMDASSPLAFGSQDALNALLTSEITPSDLSVQSWHAERFFDTQPGHVSVANLDRLECMHEGHRVSVLHRVWVDKPWQRTSWRSVKRTAYSRCLRRVLAGSDVEIQVPQSELPVWLKPGPVGGAALHLLYLIKSVVRASDKFERVTRRTWRRFRKLMRLARGWCAARLNHGR